jgi:hypothetical protein
MQLVRIKTIVCAGALVLSCGRTPPENQAETSVETQSAADASTVSLTQDPPSADAGVMVGSQPVNPSVPALPPPVAGGPSLEVLPPPPSGPASSGNPPPTVPPGSGPTTDCRVSSANRDCPGPGECWRPACIGGACTALPEAAGTICNGGRCNGLGVCNECAADADCQSNDLCTIESVVASKVLVSFASPKSVLNAPKAGFGRDMGKAASRGAAAGPMNSNC